MQLAGLVVPAGLDHVLQANHRPGHSTGQGRDGAVHAQGEAGVQQRIDAAEHDVGLLDVEQQVRQRLEVSAALLHADHARHLVHDPQHGVHAQVVPGDHVVDEDGNAGFLPDGAEVLDGGLLVGLEQVVHGRDLQRHHLHAFEHAGAADRLHGAVDDEPGQERHAPGGGLVGVLHRLDELGVRQGVALARAAPHHDTVGTGVDDEVDLLAHGVSHQAALLVEGHGDRGQHAVQEVAQVGSLRAHLGVPVEGLVRGAPMRTAEPGGREVRRSGCSALDTGGPGS